MKKFTVYFKGNYRYNTNSLFRVLTKLIEEEWRIYDGDEVHIADNEIGDVLTITYPCDLKTIISGLEMFDR